MNGVYSFEHPDRFVTGTIGQPGSRTFIVQAREGRRIASVALEKQQVQQLALRVGQVLDELELRGDDRAGTPTHAVSDLAPLDLPLDEEFRVGAMTIGWDADKARLLIQLFSVDVDEVSLLAELDDDLSRLEAFLTADQAREFVARTQLVVSAGRPACPFCAQPINPEGHVCPRANGYRRDFAE